MKITHNQCDKLQEYVVAILNPDIDCTKRYINYWILLNFTNSDLHMHMTLCLS